MKTLILIEAFKKACPELSEEQLKKLVACVHKVDNRTNHDEDVAVIRDPVSGLTLPPPAKTEPYKVRRKKYSKDASVEEILESEWGAYISAGLAYAGFIKEADKGIYDAIRYEARKRGTSLEKVMKKCGIFTSETIQTPPNNHRQQASLIKKVLSARRSERVKTTIYQNAIARFLPT